MSQKEKKRIKEPSSTVKKNTSYLMRSLWSYFSFDHIKWTMKIGNCFNLAEYDKWDLKTINNDHIKCIEVNIGGYLSPFVDRVDRVQVDVRSSTLFGFRRFSILQSTFLRHRTSFNRITGIRRNFSRVNVHSGKPSEQSKSDLKQSNNTD